MDRTTGIALLAIAAALLAGGTARAQDEYCAQHAREICGDNQTISQCFDDQRMWSSLDPDCTGAVQTIIEGEREATQSENDSAVNLYGQSYGGVLRSGPGQEFSRVASLREGDSVEIIGDPNVWWNDYKWFKVRTDRGIGYHWGGILCVPSDTPPAGVYSNCQ
ncbi:MAG: SH3 domain-containing protein [Rhizobiaceae bacterium]|nr:MAG: SH3 domain-containing protein [Rhizobiaceae bacterium]